MPKYYPLHDDDFEIRDCDEYKIPVVNFGSEISGRENSGQESSEIPVEKIESWSWPVFISHTLLYAFATGSALYLMNDFTLVGSIVMGLVLGVMAAGLIQVFIGESYE